MTLESLLNIVGTLAFGIGPLACAVFVVLMVIGLSCAASAQQRYAE